MSIIRDFVTKLPAACGVPAGLAEIYGELNGKLFDFELANPDGPLHRRNFDSIWERIELGFRPWDVFAKRSLVTHAQSLLEFAARTIDADGGDWRGKEEEKARLLRNEAETVNAPIAAMLTVEQASVLGNWA